MATHSSVLACRIPGTGEPDGLLSMGLHRVGHEWSKLAAAAATLNQWFLTLKPTMLHYCYQCFGLWAKILKLALNDYWASSLAYADGKESTCSAGDLGSVPGSGRSSGEGNGNPLPVFLLGESHEQRSLAGYSPWGCKELDTTERPTLTHSPSDI